MSTLKKLALALATGVATAAVPIGLIEYAVAPITDKNQHLYVVLLSGILLAIACRNEKGG